MSINTEYGTLDITAQAYGYGQHKATLTTPECIIHSMVIYDREFDAIVNEDDEDLRDQAANRISNKIIEQYQ